MNIIKVGKIDETLPDWTLAKSNIPQWYKDINGINEKNIVFDESNNAQLNVKSCIPFFDSFASGYMINLWCDLYFEQMEDGSHFIRWGSTTPDPVGFRDHNRNIIPTPWGCTPYQYVWKVPYHFGLPSGYSAFVTHPLNRPDLPFVGMSGIIDADPVISTGHYPFFIKESFNGVLPAGTPILQIIPFKRESWKIENSKEIEEMGRKYLKENSRRFMGFYKQNKWKRKSYE